jgi:hypothetical protein
MLAWQSFQKATEATMPTHLRPRARAAEAESAARAAARSLNLRLVLAAIGTLAAVFSFLVDREGLQGAFAQIGRTLEASAHLIASVGIPFG